MRSKNKIIICLLIGLMSLALLGPSSLLAGSSLKVKVDVIKADRNSSHVDPQLIDLVKELSPVLNFTGFTLVKKSEMRLDHNKKDEVILSSDRSLELHFLGFDENQGRLQVRIMEDKKEMFKTVVLLVDNGHVLIGGPPQDGGVLLLRIGGEF